jgi:secondary thiamine-phosphate synthase enzyme
MKWHKQKLEITTRGKGLYNFTNLVQELVQEWAVEQGMCYLYMPHTSASLVVNESYDPSAKSDMQEYMERAVPENQAWFRHTSEGSDDSPSHIRAMLTHTSLTIPVDNGKLSLGIWQGLYLFEHRSRPHRRNVLVRCLAID